VVITDRLVQLSTEKEEGTRDIASLGLKTVVGEIKPSSSLASTVSTRLVPKLIDQLNQASGKSRVPAPGRTCR
jgi:cullin-associated NEDD8-dissociated protein 1